MEFESWWLLAIPLFFGLGWFASRIDTRHERSPAAGLPDAYFKGLNFLLAEKPDQAIDAFIDVVRLDPETVELHFALGNLFRRRGETDRAIRVHQNLLERRGLDDVQREQVLFELGQDFLKAGLLDRAEQSFGRLEGTRYAAQALRHRLDIAQMVRDWPLAIELARRLQVDAGEDHARRIAHFHCELAARALAGDRPDRFEVAGRELAAAQAVAPAHPRPRLQLGELAAARGEPQAAIAAWREVASSNPGHLSLLADEWLKAHESLGRLREGIESLEATDREHSSVDTFAALAAAHGRLDGPRAAKSWAEARLRETPSLLGLDALLALRAQSEGEDSRGDIELTRSLIQTQARRLSRYVCNHCGFKARQYFWHCPGCHRWDSYAPRRSEELDKL